MNNKTHLRQLCKALIGRKVRSKRLGVNLLFLYLDGKPDDKNGFGIRIESLWNLIGPDGIITGSGEIYRYGIMRIDKRFKDIESRIDSLLMGKSVQSVKVNWLTRDLKLFLNNGLCIETFNTDPSEPSSFRWGIGNRRTKETVFVLSSWIYYSKKYDPSPSPTRTTQASS